MPRIAIISDSDCSLPLDLAAQHEISIVPISIHFGDEIFAVGTEMDDTELFRRVDQLGALPTTSAPAPGKFLETYQSALDNGAESIVCLCVSSAVSGTYNAALVAKEMLPDADITVIDTQSISVAQGYMVLAAVEAAGRGATTQETVEAAMAVGERCHLYGALSTLKYLAMSGRVGHLAAGMASVLSIRPVLTIRDGKLDLLEKVRTRKKTWARMIELVQEDLQGQPVEKLAILHVAALDEAKEFEAQLRAAIPCPPETLYAALTAGLSVHTGSGMVGLTVVRGE